MIDRARTKIVVLFMLLVAVAPPAWTQQTQQSPAASATGIGGTYNLVSVAGKVVPNGSGSITLNNDGTLTSAMNWGDGGKHNFKGTYVKEGDIYVLTWAGAGQTAVQIDGPKLMMNNEGMVFVYWKEGVPQTPLETKRVAGGLEAEKMVALGKTGGNVQEQPMAWFGTQWSGDAQLWWTGATPGDRLDLELDVKQRGTYLLTAQFTKANDYGIAQFYLDGKKLDGPIDLYNDGVIVSDVVDLGQHELDARPHKLTVEIVGANPRAVPAYMVGIDYFRLSPVESPSPAARGGVGTTSATVAGSPMDPAEAQKVLDRFLGTWSWEVTTYTPGSNPEEKHATGRSLFIRVLRGNFVEETGEDSEKDTSLVLYTYDQHRECYRFWVFLSKYGGPDAPFNGKWNETTRTIDWAVTTAEGHSLTSQHRFMSDDAFECTILAKDTAGKTLWRQEFKFTRVKESQKQENPNQPATGISTPNLGQAAEQRVLDRLLGTWSRNWEATVSASGPNPEEKHAAGRSSCTRVLRGNFIQETGEDSEGNSTLVLYTYDQRRECYRLWLFESQWGGPEAPTTGKWNEAALTLDWTCQLVDGPNAGCSIAGQHRFISEDTFESSSMAKDRVGKTLWSQEYKYGRAKELQK